MFIEVETDYIEGIDLTPVRAYSGDAGADLRSAVDIKIRPHSAELVNTGVKIAIPYGYVGILVSRSGHSKQRVSLANRIGIIDHQYRGHIMARLENLGEQEFNIKRGDRIAQLLIMPVLLPEFIESDLSETERGETGFGSTGVK